MKQATYKPVKNLLAKGETNSKTAKNVLETYIMYLAPANESGLINTCPFASEGCKSSCLYTAGRGKFSNVVSARVNKTLYFAINRKVFLLQLTNEILKIWDKAKKAGVKIAVRLNGTSDIDFLALIKKETGIDFLNDTYNNVLFYDYTKNFNTVKKYLNTRYHLTFSLSESNYDTALKVLSLGGNIAAVFRNQLPNNYNGYTVINGDETDLRYFDPVNVIVGLKAKGEAKKDYSGFVIG